MVKNYNDHHWYGHAYDANEVNSGFVRGIWISLFILFGIPVLLAIPHLLVVFILIWIFVH